MLRAAAQRPRFAPRLLPPARSIADRPLRTAPQLPEGIFGRRFGSAALPSPLPGPGVVSSPGGVEEVQKQKAAKTKDDRRSLSTLYWKLAKGKLTVWVSISAMPGYLLAVPGAVDPCVLAALVGGTFLTSASAQTMNQIIEIPRDARMNRTAMRPLPSGALSPREAKAFAAASGASGLALLALGADPTAAVIAGATMATYAGVYTPMKVLSPYNTHVGAISGALPVLLGFSAALGSGLAGSPWAGHAAWLFAMQVLWQMPHFYALAWIHRADYLRGGYNMFPLSDKTGLATAAMSKPYLLALGAMPCAASALGLASWMLPVGAAVPSALWWRSLKAFEDKPSIPACRKFFLGSLSYLLATLGLFTAYARIGFDEVEVTDCGVAREPAWRGALSAKIGELCPHERFRGELFGLMRRSCPFAFDAPAAEPAEGAKTAGACPFAFGGEGGKPSD